VEPLLLSATPLESARLRSSQFTVVVSGIGAVNTAHGLTQYLTTHPRPSLVIQSGIGGAYVPGGLPVGAVALATSEVYADVGVSTPQGWRPLEEIGIPLVAGNGLHPDRFNEFPLDAALVARAAAASASRVARTGPFVTVSTVTGIRARGDELYARYHGICESMEGAAAAHICALHGVPFLEVRGVSNLVEDRNRAAWKIAEAAEAAQAAALHLAEYFRTSTP
jgi:futalosine hydrolase